MSDQTPIHIQTAGPADEKAGTRAKVWAGLAVLTPLLAALATFGILSDGQANAINGAITAGIGLMTAFGFGFAAKKTNDQVKNGTFDAAPELPAVPALEQLVILRDNVTREVDTAVAAVQTGAATMQIAAQTAASVLGALPGAAQAAGAVGDLVRGVQNLTPRG